MIILSNASARDLRSRRAFAYFASNVAAHCRTFVPTRVDLDIDFEADATLRKVFFFTACLDFLVDAFLAGGCMTSPTIARAAADKSSCAAYLFISAWGRVLCARIEIILISLSFSRVCLRTFLVTMPIKP